MKLRHFWGLASLALLLAGCVSAEDQAVLDAVPSSRTDLVQVPGLIREPLPVTVTLPDGTTALLDGSVVRPDRPGRFPLVLINHGTSSEWSERKDTHSTAYAAQAIAFAERGWAAISVVRPGFGRSGGPFLESIGPCENRDFVAGGTRMGNEVLAILQAVQQQNLPWADNAHVLLVGQSGGGLASIAAAATRPASVVGIINFAGGDGAPIHGDYFCQSDRLVTAMGVFGKTAQIPSLWIYSANDTKFPPHLAQQMFSAYRAGGAPATMIAAPAYQDEGHYFIEAIGQWQPMIDQFLTAQKLPDRPDPAVATSTQIVAPAALNDADFFKKYLAIANYEKAFAVGDHGGAGYADGYPTVGAAKLIALQVCKGRDSGCHIYAVGDQLAP